MDLQDIEKLKKSATQQIWQAFTKFPKAYTSDKPFLPGFGIQRVKDGFGLVIHLSSAHQRYLLKDIERDNKICVRIVPKVMAQSNLQPGSPISYEQGSQFPGTLGCFVQKKNQSELFLLSNVHVLKGFATNCVYTDQLHVANLDNHQHLIPFDFTKLQELEQQVNDSSIDELSIDAAIAAIIDPTAICQENHKSYFLKGYRTQTYIRNFLKSSEKDLGYPVFKMGHRTKLTQGLLVDLDVPMIVEYSNMLCAYKKLYIVQGQNGEPFSDRGDSGSIVYDKEGFAIALIIGGGEQEGRMLTYAHPIDIVLDRLNVNIATLKD